MVKFGINMQVVHPVAKLATNASGAIWWPCLQPMQVVHPVAKLATDASGAIWWPNLQPIQEVSLKSISNYSNWEIYSSYGLNTLGPLCLWQCFLWVFFSLFNEYFTIVFLLLHNHQRKCSGSLGFGARPAAGGQELQLLWRPQVLQGQVTSSSSSAD